MPSNHAFGSCPLNSSIFVTAISLFSFHESVYTTPGQTALTLMFDWPSNSACVCVKLISAAFIAHIEAIETDEMIKNEVCAVVPHPDNTLDWVRTTLQNAVNSIKWNSNPGLKQWLIDARLDGFGRVRGRSQRTPRQKELSNRIGASTPDALAKLESYLQESSSEKPE